MRYVTVTDSQCEAAIALAFSNSAGQQVGNEPRKTE
jgi:hypothetical protein